MAVTNKQLLDMHKRALDTIRAAIDGLDRESLCWCEPETGQWIAQEVSHLCNTERYWIEEEGIDPQLDTCPELPSSLEEELRYLWCVEQRWVELLPTNPGLRYALFRVCLHALYHLARIAHLRRHQQSGWRLPDWNEPGSWEYATDPIIPGHEFSGDVIEVSKNVTTVKLGDRVAVDPGVFCRKCSFCRENRQNFCENFKAYGVFFNGGFAELAAIKEENVYKIDGLSYVEGAMVEPVGCGIHGMKQINERTIKKTSDIDVDQEALYRGLLKDWKDKRIAFEQKFDGSDRFKYGALNFSKIGIIGRYGYFYVILERLKIEQYLSLVFIMYDSLRNYVDNNCCVNIGQLAQEVANKDHVQILSSIKHEIDIGSTPDYDWSKVICNDDNYVEAIMQDEIKVEHIRIVYIKKSKFNELHNEILNKLADGSDAYFVKLYLSDLNTILEKMDQERIRWEVLNE